MLILSCLHSTPACALPLFPLGSTKLLNFQAFSKLFQVVGLLRRTSVKMMSLMVTFVAHSQPPYVPSARSRVHLPQSRRPDNKSLVLQNKSHLSRDKWLLFSIKRQLFQYELNFNFPNNSLFFRKHLSCTYRRNENEK